MCRHNLFQMFIYFYYNVSLTVCTNKLIIVFMKLNSNLAFICKGCSLLIANTVHDRNSNNEVPSSEASITFC